VLVRVLDCTSERQQLNVLELEVARRFVFTLARVELGNDAVDNVPVVVHHQNVSDANVFVVQEGIANVPDDLVQLLVALQAFHAERDPGHDRLFLLNDHARVGADLAQVEVILDAEGEPEHQRQQQKQPGAKALYRGGKFHAKPKRV
jgi:hypothetical protein